MVFLAEIRQALEKRDYNLAKELAEQHLMGQKRVNMGPICLLGIFTLSSASKVRLCLR